MLQFNLKKLRWFLFSINCLLPLLLIASYFVPLDYLYEPGQQIGRISLVLIWLILLPGIIKRLNLKGKIAKLGVKIRVLRRQLGIMMFQLGLIHWFWMVNFFYIQFGFPTDPSKIPVFQSLGLFALILLIPLYITSNDFSTKLLKKSWHYLHRLIYLALLLLLFHVALNFKISGLLWAIPSTLIFILEIISWGKVLTNSFQKKVAN